MEPSERKMFYRKRKLGYGKKANDMSILCDSPVLALSFSPDGKADLVLGPNTYVTFNSIFIVFYFAYV